MAQYKMTFENHNGVRKCAVPTGELVITRVPRMGLMGVHRPKEGRSQVFVPVGKYNTLSEMSTALVTAWREFTGLDDIRSFV